MSRKAPRTIEEMRRARNAAVQAWTDLDGAPPASARLWRRASRSKPAIYRLTFADRDRAPVYAKRSQNGRLAIERLVYERILSRLSLTVPRYRGSRDDDDGWTWLFVEDVGTRRLSLRDPGHRALASRWLGVLHCSAAELAASVGLPDAGPGRYLAHLRAGREAIHENLGNTGLTAADHEVLSEVLQHVDGLESRWPNLERACEGLPVTLVHGDFRMKNVRIRVTGPEPALFPIDWEMAGWGIPAADLASAWAPGLTIPIDPRTYETTVASRWPQLDAAALRRLSILGGVFQALAAVEWASASLIFESPRYLLKPVSQMRRYVTQIAKARKAGAEWLG